MPSDQSLNILACQITIPSTNDVAARDAHLTQSTDKVRRELENGAVDLVVLPELSSIDYSRDAFRNLDTLAEPLDGPSFTAWQKIAIEFNTHILFSFPRRGEGEYHISAAAIGPDGELIGHYDKLHLAQYGASMEKEYFERGKHLLAFDVLGFRVAPIICYDIRIPELSRTLVLDHGVDAICHVGAYARDPSFYSWHHFAVSRALENQIYFLSLNRAGDDFGNSVFCTPWIDETMPPTVFADVDEDFKRLTLNRSEIDIARETYSFLKDRRDQYNFKVSEN